MKPQEKRRKHCIKLREEPFEDIPSRRLVRMCMNQTGMWKRIGMSQEVLIASDTIIQKKMYNISSKAA